MRKLLVGLGILTLAWVVWPAGQVVSQQIREVLVVNLPDSQKIHGEVTVESPVPAGRAWRKEGVVVPPVERHETAVLVPGGTLETQGFTILDLALQGEVRGAQFRDGEVGVVLIPDEGPVLRAFNEADQFQFPLEAIAPLTAGGPPFFASDATTLEISFPRYRVYFYNSGNRSVEVNLYAYLKN